MSLHDGWRHCPRCAGPLAVGPLPHEDEPRLHCAACGLVLYENPAPTASAVVVRDGRVLLTRRARPPAAGAWDVPGGFVEPGEGPEEATRRELLEETGLEVRLTGLLGVIPDAYGPAGTPTLNLFYTAEAAGGVEEAASDVSELGWFTPEELPLDEIAFPCCREALRLFLLVGEAAPPDAGR